MAHQAIVKRNDSEDRWELWIDGKLKAYNTPDGSEQDLIKLAEEKGYTVELQS